MMGWRMKQKRLGRQTIIFEKAPCIASSAAIVGDVEGRGPLGSYFDLILQDDTWGEKSWELAERKMFEHAVRMAAAKLVMPVAQVNCLLGGDLLNQIISANYAARSLKIPFLGLYGACSTMAESLLIAGMLMDGGFLNSAACVASSHFSTAERQFRMPLEMGGQMTPTAQRTVTGAGCVLLTDTVIENALYPHLRMTGGVIGRVIDLGITDGSNMGAAMAPAAADTISTFFSESGHDVSDFDLIVTGDLGSFGSSLFLDLCKEEGLDLRALHVDCGNLIFSPKQNVNCGGSGCGCSGSVLSAYLLGRMEAGDFHRIIFMATGALMSPVSSMQGDSIPGIAHAVILERVER